MFFSLIRQLQMKRITPETLKTLARQAGGADSRLPLLAEAYTRFQAQTADRRLLCHADLLNRAVDALDSSAESVAWLTSRFDMLVVDEAQELSETHHRFLSRLP